MTTGVSQLGRAEVGLKPGSRAAEFELLAWRGHSEDTPLDPGFEQIKICLSLAKWFGDCALFRPRT